LFYHTPSSPRLTTHQRDLLIKLVTLTRSEGQYAGEFWWRADPDQPNIVTQIRPRTFDGNFDPDNPLFQRKQWPWVADQANMLALERFGYVVISDAEEYGSEREKWKHFAVTQLGFDFHDHIHRPLILRFVRQVWEKTENHLLAFAFGVLGALTIEVIKHLVQVVWPGGIP
jgi:hypothetical protein